MPRNTTLGRGCDTRRTSTVDLPSLAHDTISYRKYLYLRVDMCAVKQKEKCSNETHHTKVSTTPTYPLKARSRPSRQKESQGSRSGTFLINCCFCVIKIIISPGLLTATIIRARTFHL